MSDDPPPWFMWPLYALAGFFFDVLAAVIVWRVWRAGRR